MRNSSATGQDVSPSSTGEALPLKRMRTLWERMTEIYGHKWTSAYGEDAEKGAGLTWAKGLMEVTPRQLAAGLSGAIASSDPWPPTLPEFRRLCLGIPSLGAVQFELRNNKGARSPFLCQVWTYVDGYLFARADQTRADRMLRDAYELAVEFVMRGGALPERPVGEIEAPKPEPHVPATSETAAENIAKIEALLRETQPPIERVEAEAVDDSHEQWDHVDGIDGDIGSDQ